MLGYERVQKYRDRMLKATSVTRTSYDIVRIVTGQVCVELEERREK